MIRWLPRRRYTPIGIDVGSRSIKLVQFTADRTRVVDVSRVELAPLPEEAGADARVARLADAIATARQGRQFKGRDVVLGLGDKQLFLQNIRVARGAGAEMDRLVQQEVAGKLPFPVVEAEIRYLEAADVRQGEQVLREVVVFACHQPTLDATLALCDAARLTPLAIDVEPAALARAYAAQYRREADQAQRAVLVHFGYTRSAVVIAQGDDILFVKYVDVGGALLDAAVARHLKMTLTEATSLRRHNGDRRNDQQAPETARSIAEATRPVLDRLVGEIAMCVRYHSVTFRGQPLVRLVLGGGEASPQILEALNKSIDLKGEMSDPFRALSVAPTTHRKGQWDVAAGLALRDLE